MSRGAAEATEVAGAAQVAGVVVTEQDDRDLRADLAARRVLAEGRRARAPEPARLSVGRAVAGAAVSVAGVCLGIGTLLWVTDDPSQGPGPVVTAPAAASDEAARPEPPAVVPEPPAVAEVPAVVAPSPVPPPAPAPPPAAAPAPAAQAPSPVVPVTVLNNSRITGLADRAAERFRAGGWPVAQTGNFRGQIPVTTVYYDDPGLQASAQAFADAFDGIARVRPAFDTLPASGLVVVLTREFSP